MNNTHKLVALGRFMMLHAPGFQDDVKFNTWARVGQMLTEVGAPFGKRFAEFDAEEQGVAREAAQVLVGRVAMPEKMEIHMHVEHKRRKPRMTKVMTKRS